MRTWDLENDPQFQAYLRSQEAAADEATQEQLTADIAARRKQRENPTLDFIKNLPRNFGVGAYKAIVETIDSLPELGAMMTPEGQIGLAAQALGGRDGEDPGMYEVAPLSAHFPEFMSSVKGFTESWERNDTVGDDIAQGVAQFTLPFMGWLKAAGGLRGATKTMQVAKGLGAEAATTATAFDPHDGRFADLAKFGRDSETQFGNLLRRVAPDDSLVNAYIDYMTDRENEGQLEGRFKNAVDSVTSSAAIAGLIKSAAVTHKGLTYSLENATGSAGGKGVPNQAGMVAFHGTPHDFDAFDLNKIGTGEGAQAFGEGLYFAEAKDTAKHYRFALSRRGVTPGSSMDNAITEMERANWDAREAYANTMRAASRARDPEYRDVLLRAAEKIKAGNVKQLGKLMTVEIPDDAVAKMLDYDAPLSDQPEVAAKLQKMVEKLGQTGTDVVRDYKTGGEFIDDWQDLHSPGKSRQMLLEADIPGIRYWDERSRGSKNGTRNLVLFDDKLVKILKKD